MADLDPLFPAAPTANIEEQWSLLWAQMQAAGCADVWTAIAVNGTIRVECPPYWPIDEYGSASYFEANYGPQTSVGQQLGNIYGGDGARYHGRGLVQLTGRSNYRKYGTAFGVDLEGNPDLALDPNISAAVLVKYFTDHSIPAKAAAQDWTGVRRAVNGGTNGLATFLGVVNALVAVAQGKGIA